MIVREKKSENNNANSENNNNTNNNSNSNNNNNINSSKNRTSIVSTNELPNYELVMTLEGHSRAVSNVQFSHDGKLIASSCSFLFFSSFLSSKREFNYIKRIICNFFESFFIYRKENEMKSIFVKNKNRLK